MALGTFKVYTSAIEEFFKATQIWESDDHYVILASGYVPSLGHQTVADVVVAEISDPDYSPQDLAGEAVISTGGTIRCDATDVSFGNSVTISADHVIIVKGTAAAKSNSDKLVGYMRLGGTDAIPADISTSGTEFSIAWPSNGLFIISSSDNVGVPVYATVSAMNTAISASQISEGEFAYVLAQTNYYIVSGGTAVAAGVSSAGVGDIDGESITTGAMLNLVVVYPTRDTLGESGDFELFFEGGSV